MYKVCTVKIVLWRGARFDKSKTGLWGKKIKQSVKGERNDSRKTT